MDGTESPRTDPPEPGGPARIGQEISALETEFGLASARPSRVRGALEALAAARARTVPADRPTRWSERLAALLARQAGEAAGVLFDFLESEVRDAPHPARLLAELVRARDGALAGRALDLALEQAAAGRVRPVPELVGRMAEAVEARPAELATPERLTALASFLGSVPAETDGDPAGDLYESHRPRALRQLAARILDLPGEPVPRRRLARLLGEEAAAFLVPYVEFTRATHGDLVELTAEPRSAREAVDSLVRAENALGHALLGRVLGELGWPRAARGLSVRRVVGLSFEGGFPLVLTPAEARLFEIPRVTRRTWERYLVVARGGSSEPGADAPDEAVIRRLRDYHLEHAAVLAELLEVAPLTAAKARRILAAMGRIVEDFAQLFAEQAAECERVLIVYERLRVAVEEHITGAPDDEVLAPETMRLVQMFEDPQRLDEVHTIHGLKRYLHQQGLRHVFGLFAAAAAANRTVDVAVASSTEVLHVLRSIRWVDFEPDSQVDEAGLPPVVSFVVDAVARHLLHDHPAYPHVDVLGFGNEVHVYARFRNHPVFIRVDLSPPVTGGMIDLDCFAVSQYEVDQHPDLTLPAIGHVFRRLDFDVETGTGHLHARYDKEHAFELADLVEKARTLFCLLPHLMDLDWTVASLDYPEPVRTRVAERWTQILLHWGVVPLERLLTTDRRHARQGPLPGVGPERLTAWDGDGECPDPLGTRQGPRVRERLRCALEERDLDGLVRWEADSEGDFGQLALERCFLEPLREAVADGEVVETAAGLLRARTETFRRELPAVRFARLLLAGAPRLVEAARAAVVVGAVDRSLRCRTVGSLQGYPVQRGRLKLRDCAIHLFVLRDAHGIARLAVATERSQLFRSRPRPGTRWKREPDLRAAELVRRLRRDNYLAPGYEPAQSAEDPRELVARFLVPNPLGAACRPFPGERVLAGVVAAPGRASGLARFGPRRGSEGDLDGAVVFAQALRPEDAPVIARAAAVVSTGGGVLSHAGLVALELHKPALIVGGRWRPGADGVPELAYRWRESRDEERKIGPFHVVSSVHEREHEAALREGDLVVVDAEMGGLTVLGRDAAALAFFRELTGLAAAEERLLSARTEPELLRLRGRVLRSVHQLDRVLRRIDRPAVARFAVQELLRAVGSSGESAGGGLAVSPSRAAPLLTSLLANPDVGGAARATAHSCRAEIVRRHEIAGEEAIRRIPRSDQPFEIVFLRWTVLRLHGLLREMDALLVGCGIAEDPVVPAGDLDDLSRRRLERLRERTRNDLREANATEGGAGERGLRHVLFRARTLERLLRGDGAREDRELAETSAACERADREALRRLTERRVISGADGGVELAPLVGWKAAHLGELARLLGAGRVPEWFAVTDRAFREILDSDAGEPGNGATSLGEAIARALERGNDPARTSAEIHHLWERTELPPALAAEVGAAYRAQCGGEETYVAIRSSAREEDTEEASWAGQFETFLFVRGERSLLDFLKLAFAGLWSERALEHRLRLRGASSCGGGGVIVQRMVNARAAGVLHTVGAGTGSVGEMVVNVGLGLGEGVVSGTVDVDQIHVSKEGDLLRGPLRFRHLVADKRERVVLDVRTGCGTRRETTPYHQRMRPALEYPDLCELVRTAAGLEGTYGRPLDIEFAFEGDALRVLQVRPVAVFESVVRDTIRHHPWTARAVPNPEGSRR